MANISQLIAPSGVLTAADAFRYESVSGATQALDVGSSDFFNAGTLTSDVTISFSNVPTEARWSYSFVGDLVSSYDIENASYDSVSFSVASQATNPSDLFFKADGTKIYVVEQINDSVYQYSLSTAWDLNTASYDGVSFSVASQENFPQGLFFKDDGTKMYVVGYTQNDGVYQYSLSTAWDLSTASYDSVIFSVAGQEAFPRGLFFKDDGTKMYVVGTDNARVYQYSLSTAWDLSTASYDSVSFSVASQETGPQGLFFKDDGTKMYVVGSSSDSVYQYSLSTAWDVSTASYDSVSFSVAGQETTPFGFFFKDDGTKMYVVGSSSDSVYQYSTGSYGTITLPASVQNSPSEAFTTDRVTYTFFTDDGGTNVHLISEEIE